MYLRTTGREYLRHRHPNITQALTVERSNLALVAACFRLQYIVSPDQRRVDASLLVRLLVPYNLRTCLLVRQVTTPTTLPLPNGTRFSSSQHPLPSPRMPKKATHWSNLCGLCECQFLEDLKPVFGKPGTEDPAAAQKRVRQHHTKQIADGVLGDWVIPRYGERTSLPAKPRHHPQLDAQVLSDIVRQIGDDECAACMGRTVQFRKARLSLAEQF